MPPYTLTFLDTARIQEYVFGSNVLRENVGASELVRRATRQWPLEEVRAAGRTNLKPGRDPIGEPDDLAEGLRIQKDDLDAEVIYAGGGNCAILFKERREAKSFLTRLSRRALAEAPGLDLVAVHVEVNWRKDALAAKTAEALDKLVTKKLSRAVSTPMMGLGVTVGGSSLGLPAVGTDADEPDLKPPEAPARPLSAEVMAKLRVVAPANTRLEDLFPRFADDGFDIPHDLDHFGREEGDISYIAVVHADGNDMSGRLEQLRRGFPGAGDNRAYIGAMRAFSRGVEDASRQALDEISLLLLRHWRPLDDAFIGRTQDEWGEMVDDGEILPSKGMKRRFFIPFRPLVFGGDDLTFVCDGRLGLSLATAYLDAYERAMGRAAQRSEFVAGLQASAGVAVVKTHYPFSRAYDLAAGLCRNAKEVWERKCSALDWHFAASGLFGNIQEIRDRQYTTPDGHLEARPLQVGPQPSGWRSWQGIADAITAFHVHKGWRDRRSKVIALRDALRAGREAVSVYLTAHGLKVLPPMGAGTAALSTTGWDGAGRCGYFDAIEALDFYLPLDE